jgi:hypothetical protein
MTDPKNLVNSTSGKLQGLQTESAPLSAKYAALQKDGMQESTIWRNSANFLAVINLIF